MASVLDNPVSFVKELQLPSDSDLGLFLEKLKHASSPFSKSLTLQDNEKSAQVNAGSLTSFTENLSGQNKADVQNSTLLAQLASDKKFDRNTQPMDWYSHYTYILGGIGWNQPAFAFDSYTSGGTTVKLDEAVLGILAAIATANEIAMIAETMEGLRGLSDDSKQMLIWDSNSNSGNNGNFQIFPVDRLANDDVVMILDGMQFNATSSHYRFLWWTWDSTSIQIQRAANKFVLNESVYSRVRQAIVDKLGDRAEQLVAEIEI
ncbi:hypothetical protein [Sphingomonas sanxanigenens]|uniref:Uncharacterized protein n=1 Tax=Sphingomonas sanxanigenens DSM 19645 = NX02 TaxID=1123269 RepID=W0A8A3_9SPHN|nr:hypothetical protein [Sphingomonas sanxanigenens]AHE51900.1 hypothetical protein NX02_00665 [Sphingomonas sanxanigenens DSM 19645 = NX02]